MVTIRATHATKILLEEVHVVPRVVIVVKLEPIADLAVRAVSELAVP